MTTSSLDTVLSRRRLSPNDWVKSSLKVTLPDINSSVMSNSPATAQRLYHLKENIQQISQCGVPKYTIQSLLGISQGTHLTHTDACSKVVEFLNSSGNEEIQTEGSLSRMDNLPAHFLSKKVIPDVAWFTDTQHNQLVCARFNPIIWGEPTSAKYGIQTRGCHVNKRVTNKEVGWLRDSRLTIQGARIGGKKRQKVKIMQSKGLEITRKWGLN